MFYLYDDDLHLGWTQSINMSTPQMMQDRGLQCPSVPSNQICIINEMSEPADRGEGGRLHVTNNAQDILATLFNFHGGVCYPDRHKNVHLSGLRWRTSTSNYRQCSRSDWLTLRAELPSSNFCFLCKMGSILQTKYLALVWKPLLSIHIFCISTK